MAIAKIMQTANGSKFEHFEDRAYEYYFDGALDKIGDTTIIRWPGKPLSTVATWVGTREFGPNEIRHTLYYTGGFINPNKSVIPSDPHGIDQHAPGAKLDAGKPRVGLVLDGFSLAIMAVSQVGTYGANKYTDSGWESVKDGKARYKDALLRHILRAKQEEIDPESHLPHLAHAAWNALAVLELALREKEAK